MFIGDPFVSVQQKEKKLKQYERFLDLFQKDIFVDVSEWDGDDFLIHIESILSKATDYLESKRIDDKDCYISRIIIPSIIGYYNKFPEVIKLLLEGKRSHAYKILSNEIMYEVNFASMWTFKDSTHKPTPKITEKFREKINEIEDEDDRKKVEECIIDAIIENNNKNNPFSEWEKGTDYVYRMRSINNYQSRIQSLDLFHVPFEKRHLLGNNRFSLSGVPCLYCGSSIYGCWEELDRPNLDYCFTSRFDLTEHDFMDLSRKADDISIALNKVYTLLRDTNESVSIYFVNQFEYIIEDYLRIWPIIFCSSVKTVHNRAAFKPEYMFPQLLLEWIIDDFLGYSYDGIKYISTKSPSLKDEFEDDIQNKMINYVIPAREIKKSGYCEENLNKITATEPINLLIEKSANNIKDSGSKPYLYRESVFGQLEEILKNKEFKKLTSDKYK